VLENVTPASNNDKSLEQHIGALLREQPLRRAPATLQARVLAEIAQRVAVPWWQRGFVQWPLAPRLGFILTSLALGAGLVWLTGIVRAVPWPQALQHVPEWVHVAAQLGSAAVAATAAVQQSIPLWWLDCAAAFGVALYLALFAVGAAAYRALYSNP
jgi:hypothetical protein